MDRACEGILFLVLSALWGHVVAAVWAATRLVGRLRCIPGTEVRFGAGAPPGWRAAWPWDSLRILQRFGDFWEPALAAVSVR